LGAGLWLVWRTARILRKSREAIAFRYAFKHINGFACVVISLLSLGGLLR
jgi:hypothetical protein